MKSSMAADKRRSTSTKPSHTEPASPEAGSAVWCSKVLYGLRMLPKDIREDLLQKEQESLSENLDSDWITEDLKQEAEHYGLTDVEINWSLGHCQGDGVAFNGHPDVDNLAKKSKNKDLIKVLRALKARDVTYSLTIENRGHYSHWNSMNSDFQIDHSHGITDREEKVANWIENCLEEIIKDISRALEKYGYDCIDNCTNEEEAMRRLLEDDGLYTVDGEPEEDVDLNYLCESCPKKLDVEPD